MLQPLVDDHSCWRNPSSHSHLTMSTVQNVYKKYDHKILSAQLGHPKEANATWFYWTVHPCIHPHACDGNLHHIVEVSLSVRACVHVCTYNIYIYIYIYEASSACIYAYGWRYMAMTTCTPVALVEIAHHEHRWRAATTCLHCSVPTSIPPA